VDLVIDRKRHVIRKSATAATEATVPSHPNVVRIIVTVHKGTPEWIQQLSINHPSTVSRSLTTVTLDYLEGYFSASRSMRCWRVSLPMFLLINTLSTFGEKVYEENAVSSGELARWVENCIYTTVFRVDSIVGIYFMLNYRWNGIDLGSIYILISGIYSTQILYILSLKQMASFSFGLFSVCGLELVTS